MRQFLFIFICITSLIAVGRDFGDVNVVDVKDYDVTTAGVKIKSADIHDGGVASSYISHSFELDTNGEAISSYNWSFSLKEESGDWTSVADSEKPIFTIDRISSPQDCYVRLDGTLEGLIECDYAIDGKKYKAQSFNLVLDLKPSIISIDNLKKVESGDSCFYLMFDVRYIGADYIMVEVEEEFDAVVRFERFDEPDYAQARTGNISSLYYSWVTVSVKNQYGEAFETIEFEPSDTGYADIDSPLDGRENPVKIYNLYGVKVFEGMEQDFINSDFAAGIYLKATTNPAATLKTTKILKR